MMLWLWQVATDSTVAHAANEAARSWSAEEWRDLIVGVIGALVAGFIAWQNKVILAQGVAHEKRAQSRAKGHTPTGPFPGEKRSRGAREDD